MRKRKYSSKPFPLTRRSFLKAAGAAGVVYWLGPKLMIGGKAYAQASELTLDPTTIPKYETPLVIPPAMPRTSVISPGIDYYEIAIRQFQQQILPAGQPQTTVWSYGSVTYPSTFNYPAFTIEAKFNRPVRVKWMNQLFDGGRYLPHLLPVDPTLHWANPPQGSEPKLYGTGPIDSRPSFTSTPGAVHRSGADGDASARWTHRLRQRRLCRGLVPYMVRPACKREPDIRQKYKLRPYIRYRVEGPLPTLVP